jgi:hypothetical protein
VTGVAQLAFDFDVPEPEDDLLALVRRLVVEPSMGDAEIEAVVADALGELGVTRTRAKGCCCLPGGLALDEPRCWRCGRALNRQERR